MPLTKPVAKKCARGHKPVMFSAKLGKCSACEREDAMPAAPKRAAAKLKAVPARRTR